MTTTTPPLTALEIALAATFKGERNAAGFNLDEMAERTGLNRQVYYRLETAQRHASMAQIEKVAKALGVSVTWLISDASDRADRASAALAGAELATPVARVTASVEEEAPRAEAGRRTAPGQHGQGRP